MPHFGHMEAQQWRNERYWNEEVDNIYKSHFPIFDYMFKHYGGKYMKPGDKQFMEVDEFNEMIAQAGLINDNFVSRDVMVCFNLAMMTQVNEIDKDRHIKANFIEFLEALGRAIDKISMGPEDDVSVSILKGLGRRRGTPHERQGKALSTTVLED